MATAETITNADTLTLVSAALSAMGALGMSAFALVDATKAYRGGVSNIGFGHILRGCTPFDAVLKKGAGTRKDNSTSGQATWQDILRAQWRNGRDKEAQKSVVRALIRLGLGDGEVASIADVCNVDPPRLALLVEHLKTGESLSTEESNLLGRIDAFIGFQIDAAFERADQQYRNATRALAGLVAILLGMAASLLIKPAGDGLEDFELNILYGFAAGILAVPIAPIAKDLTSSLAAAVTAVKAVRGR